MADHEKHFLVFSQSGISPTRLVSEASFLRRIATMSSPSLTAQPAPAPAKPKPLPRKLQGPAQRQNLNRVHKAKAQQPVLLSPADIARIQIPPPARPLNAKPPKAATKVQNHTESMSILSHAPQGPSAADSMASAVIQQRARLNDLMELAGRKEWSANRLARPSDKLVGASWSILDWWKTSQVPVSMLENFAAGLKLEAADVLKAEMGWMERDQRQRQGMVVNEEYFRERFRLIRNALSGVR